MLSVQVCQSLLCLGPIPTPPATAFPIMSQPLYAQVARALAEAIASGHHPAGSLLPSEAALCEQFGASRHTIREALRELVASGLVSRINGVGTRVEASRKDSGYDHSLASVDDLVQLAATNVRVVKEVGEIVADRALAAEIGCKPGSRWMHIASTRADTDPRRPPICWTDNYVLPKYAGIRKHLKRDPRALVSELIERHYGWQSAEVHQSITALGVPAAIAGELGVEPGSPALKIVRRYVDHAGECYSTTISIHPVGRFKFSMVLKRAARG